MVGDLLSQLPFLQSAATRAILNLPVYIGPIWACSKCGGINGPVNAAPFLYGINIMVHISRNGGGECGVTGPAGIPGIAAPPAKTPLREKPPTGLAASAVRHQQSNRARQRQTGGVHVCCSVGTTSISNPYPLCEKKTTRTEMLDPLVSVAFCEKPLERAESS